MKTTRQKTEELVASAHEQVEKAFQTFLTEDITRTVTEKTNELLIKELGLDIPSNSNFKLTIDLKLARFFDKIYASQRQTKEDFDLIVTEITDLLGRQLSKQTDAN